MVGHAGLVLAGYEAVLLFQLLTGSSSTSRLPLCLVLKLVAVGSILSTREYVQTGLNQSFSQSFFFSGSYILLWLCCSLLLQVDFSAVEASPLCILYFLASFAVLRLIGNNTKAEVARAQQLEKLQRLNCKSPKGFEPNVELATMADRLIHNRVFKDLLCEQHRRQIGHREGLPDWERPNTPAGKSSGRHGRTPAFFAWNEDSDSVEQRPRNSWQTETPQDEDEGMSEDAAIEVGSDTEEKQLEPTGRSIALSQHLKPQE
eukprot:jgi/Phyca11/537071/estExt2_fgenesh1_pg.C_PHYCAscaffold_720044